jgi:hypothetical protein
MGATPEISTSTVSSDLRLVNIASLDDSGVWRHADGVSLPSMPALAQSTIGKLADGSGSIEDEKDAVSRISLLFDAVAVSEPLDGIEHVRGLAEIARRYDQEGFDRDAASQAIGALITRFPIKSLQKLEELLLSGNDRQRRILLSAILASEEMSEGLAECAAKLLSEPFLAESIAKLLHIESRATLPLARSILFHLSEEMNDESGVPGYKAELFADALHTWCLATGEFSLLTDALRAPDSPMRAAGLRVLSRNGAQLGDNLECISAALRDGSRFEAREAIGGLFSIPASAHPYQDLVKDLALAADDYTGAVALELCGLIIPKDTTAFEVLVERLRPFALSISADEVADFESGDADDALEVCAELSRAMVRFSAAFPEESARLLGVLVTHPSEEVSRRVVASLAVAPKFAPLESVFDRAFEESFGSAKRSVIVASRFGAQASAWLNRIDIRLLQRQADNSLPNRSEVTELRRLVQETRRAIEGRV